VTNKENDPDGSIGAWAKRCYFVGRALMDATLRPYDLGATQWYVLHQLAHDGPIRQRDLSQTLQVERATLSAVVAVLVRKGLIEQLTNPEDQRQKFLRMTPAGMKLWQELPDLDFIHEVAFGDINNADTDTAIRVLKTATKRLNEYLQKEGKK